MIELDYPEVSLCPVDLVFEGGLARPARARRRFGVRAARRSEGPVFRRLQFGGPLGIPLDATAVRDDPDLVAFIQKEASTWRFALIHCAISFQSAAGDKDLTTAAVRIALRDPAGSGTQATAWSLLPVSASTPTQTSDSYSLGPSLTLGGWGASLGSIGKSMTREGAEVFLQAKGVLTSDPAWAFQRTKAVSLSGMYRLVLIVRTPVNEQACLTVSLEATVRTRRLILFRKTTQLPATQTSSSVYCV